MLAFVLALLVNINAFAVNALDRADVTDFMVTSITIKKALPLGKATKNSKKRVTVFRDGRPSAGPNNFQNLPYCALTGIRAANVGPDQFPNPIAVEYASGELNSVGNVSYRLPENSGLGSLNCYFHGYRRNGNAGLTLGEIKKILGENASIEAVTAVSKDSEGGFLIDRPRVKSGNKNENAQKIEEGGTVSAH